MDECIVFDNENDATEQFMYDISHNTEDILKINRFHRTILDKKGITHWYMGRYKYRSWCKGVTYKMNGLLYHSGHRIQK